MDRLIANGTVPFGQHDVAPGAGVPGMATDGNPATGLPPTDWPAYAWNMLEEEVRNAVLAAGLVPDTANWGQLATAIKAMVAARRARTLSFTAPGTYVVTPPADVTWAWARVRGGGGGGGSNCNNNGQGAQSPISGGGGGGGGEARGWFAVTPSSPFQVVVGAGGAAQYPGGTSSVASVMSATGGGGSFFLTDLGQGSQCPGGPGGVGIGGDVQLTGSYGSDGQSNALVFAGNGAPGLDGCGAGRAGAAGGFGGSAPGAAGGGAYFSAADNTPHPGGAGAPGTVELLWWSSL